MSKKRRNTPSPPVKDESKAVFVTKYEITASPIMDRAYKKLPEKVKDAIERLHYESQSKPLKAIPELLDLLKKYPQIPVLYNLSSG